MTPLLASGSARPRRGAVGRVLIGASLVLLAAGVSRAGDVPVRSAASGASAVQDARAWLRRIQESTYRRSFTGTFVVSSGGSLSSSRIIHFCDGRSQIERVDALDGQLRRVFRHDGLVHTLWPGERVAVVEHRDVVPQFPTALGPRHEVVNAAVYDALLEGTDRVAGHEAQVVLLKSRDDLRFSQRLWAERSTGLLVRADVLGPRGDVMESSAFSELVLGARLRPAALMQEMNQLQGYRVSRPVALRTDLESEGWVYREAVPGFVQVNCVKRPLEAVAGPAGASSPQGATAPLLQAIFSDGLTHVSVFIEPHSEGDNRSEGLSTLGATTSLAQRRGPWWITVVGDVPPATLRRFADTIQRRQP